MKTFSLNSTKKFSKFLTIFIQVENYYNDPVFGKGEETEVVDNFEVYIKEDGFNIENVITILKHFDLTNYKDFNNKDFFKITKNMAKSKRFMYYDKENNKKAKARIIGLLY